jgi:glutathione S-transferase
MPGPALMPTQPHLEELVEKVIQCSRKVTETGLHLVSAQGAKHWGVGSNATAAQIQRFERALQELSALACIEGGPFLAGRTVSLGDLLLWPFMERFSMCAQEFSGYDVCSTSAIILSWKEAMLQLESVKLAQANEEQFLHLVRKHRRLDWFDYEPCAVADVHPHLVW